MIKCILILIAAALILNILLHYNDLLVRKVQPDDFNLGWSVKNWDGQEFFGQNSNPTER